MADEPTRIVLVGFMGAGKTTVGERLARLLGWDFLDTDRWIEEDTGLGVAEIFREKGEAWFRDQERRGTWRRSWPASRGTPAVPGREIVR